MHAELNPCMRKTFGCMYADSGCMYAERLGAKYAVVGCIYLETFGCMYADFATYTQIVTSEFMSKWMQQQSHGHL